MKKVKRCSSCGLYNKWIKSSCERCKSRIEDIPCEYVEDDLMEDPTFQQQDESGETAEAIAVEREEPKQGRSFKCRQCGENIFFPQEASFVMCEICKNLYFKKDLDQLDEETKETKDDLPEGKEDVCLQTKYALESVLKRGNVVLTFTSEIQTFGRQNCMEEFVCNNKFISREHILYYCKNGQAYIVDTSSNGTFINGERLAKGREYTLNVGDHLGLSNEEFIVKNAD